MVPLVPLVPVVLFSLPVVPPAGEVLEVAALPDGDADDGAEDPNVEPLSVPVPVVVDGEVAEPVDGDVVEKLPLSVGVAAEDEVEPDVVLLPELDPDDGVVE